jgi:hypothetical protein
MIFMALSREKILFFSRSDSVGTPMLVVGRRLQRDAIKRAAHLL